MSISESWEINKYRVRCTSRISAVIISKEIYGAPVYAVKNIGASQTSQNFNVSQNISILLRQNLLVLSDCSMF